MLAINGVKFIGVALITQIKSAGCNKTGCGWIPKI